MVRLVRRLAGFRAVRETFRGVRWNRSKTDFGTRGTKRTNPRFSAACKLDWSRALKRPDTRHSDGRQLAIVARDLGRHRVVHFVAYVKRDGFLHVISIRYAEADEEHALLSSGPLISNRVGRLDAQGQGTSQSRARCLRTPTPGVPWHGWRARSHKPKSSMTMRCQSRARPTSAKFRPEYPTGGTRLDTTVAGQNRTAATLRLMRPPRVAWLHPSCYSPGAGPNGPVSAHGRLDRDCPGRLFDDGAVTSWRLNPLPPIRRLLARRRFPPAAASPTAMPPRCMRMPTRATRSTSRRRDGEPRPADRRERRFPPPARQPADRRDTRPRRAARAVLEQQGFGKLVRDFVGVIANNRRLARAARRSSRPSPPWSPRSAASSWRMSRRRIR